ncbi:MAG: hypothetical protein JO333_14975 [Verrucomicrobia bacterium]|nr:hypothetical protein [Verrucomicrobiota bacterium]
MKSLLPVGRSCSGGSVRGWVALVAAISISCFQVGSAFASQHSGGGGHMGGGGGHIGGGAHIGGGHFSGGFRASGFQRGALSSRNLGRSFSYGYHTDLYARHSESARSVEHRGTIANAHGAIADNHATVLDRRSDAPVSNHNEVNRTGGAEHSIAESHRLGQTDRVDPSLQNRPALANRTNTFDRSITAPRAQGLISERLNRISGRQWTGHGQVWATHSDPARGYWFQHGGYWWRCNYWGANSYCVNLITLGYAPGLCWAWYDDICWGNIVVGMPLDLVDYYYPDPVYSNYTTYDGDEATVYYYTLGDGQYQQVTVIDGNVVDVQVVDEIS